MDYALVEDGVVVSTQLPSSGALPDGSQVSGFDKLDADTLRTIGWIPIDDNGPPEYDSETQWVERALEVDGDSVTAVYTTHDIVVNGPVPPTDFERLQAHADALQDLADAQLTDTLIIYDILINNGLI